MGGCSCELSLERAWREQRTNLRLSRAGDLSNQPAKAAWVRPYLRSCWCRYRPLHLSCLAPEHSSLPHTTLPQSGWGHAHPTTPAAVTAVMTGVHLAFTGISAETRGEDEAVIGEGHESLLYTMIGSASSVLI